MLKSGAPCYLSVSQDYPVTVRGGTETFAHRLNRTLVERGFDVHAAFYGAPLESAQPTSLEGVSCHPIPSDTVEQNRLLTWSLAPVGIQPFKNLTERIKPSIVHFHGLSTNLSPDHIRAARESGSRTILTYHAPGQSCQRWDLLYDGINVCDGKIDVTRCSQCALRRLGMPNAAALLFSSSDFSALSRFAPDALTHAFERRRGTQLFESRWTEAMELADTVTYHSEWVRQLLLSNEVPEGKLLRLPLPPPPRLKAMPQPALWTHAKANDRKLLYVGRLIDIKGVHVLMEAFTKYLPNENASLLLIGGPGPSDYSRRIDAMIGRDRRILLLPPQNEPTVLSAMAAAAALIVPSIWPETGPYTVLEAQYQGTRIIGAHRAGIAERLSGTNTGFLYDPNNAHELAELIHEVLQEKTAPGRSFSKEHYEQQYALAVSKLIAPIRAYSTDRAHAVSNPVQVEIQ